MLTGAEVLNKIKQESRLLIKIFVAVAILSVLGISTHFYEEQVYICVLFHFGLFFISGYVLLIHFACFSLSARAKTRFNDCTEKPKS